MVGFVLMLKLLEKKNKLKRKRVKSIDDSILDLENEKIFDIKICRVCLLEGSIPIFEETTTENLAVALNTFGGIEVQADDEYPKYLCNPCHTLLKAAIVFRQTAQNSDEVLKHPVESEHNSDNEDLIQNDNPQSRSDNSYHCKRCKIDFESFKEYSEHRLSQEHESFRMKCPTCNKTYASMYFKRHMELHKHESPYMCDICGKKFIIKGQFTRHRLTHSYDLPFKCSLCPYRGRFTESLKMHMRSHTGERPYQCTECASRFVNKSNLNKHILTHKNEHDFKCDTCARGFYTKKELDLHFKVEHMGIKDHVCNICNKAFGYRKQMMKHQLKVHKRQKLRGGRMPLYLQVQSQKQQGEE